MSTVLAPAPSRRLSPAELTTMRARITRGTPPHRGRRAGVAAIAVAAAALLAVATGLFSHSGGGFAVDPATAAQLDQAAATALAQPALPPLTADTAFHYTDTEWAWEEIWHGSGPYTSCTSDCPPVPHDWLTRVPVVTNVWIRSDGSAVRVTRFGKVIWHSAAIRAAYARHPYFFAVNHPYGTGGRRERFAAGTYRFGHGQLTYQDLAGLPTSAAAMSAWVKHTANESGGTPYEEFTVVGDTLRGAPLSPAVRAALFGALKYVPGVAVIRHAHDPLGRSGVEFSITRGGHDRQILIIDPRTGNLLSEGDGGYGGWSVVPDSQIR